MRSNNRSTVFFVSALVAGAATVIVLMTFMDDDNSPDSPRSGFRTPEATVSTSSSPGGEPSGEPPLFATDSLINREGSYSFDHPPTWEVVSHGSVSTVTSPKKDVVIRLGFGPQGTLPVATTELSELVRSSFEVSRMGPPRERSLGGASALVFEGRATNDDDTEMRFQVTTIEGSGGENYAISVFSYPDIGRRFELSIAEVIASFRVVGTS